MSCIAADSVMFERHVCSNAASRRRNVASLVPSKRAPPCENSYSTSASAPLLHVETLEKVDGTTTVDVVVWDALIDAS